MQDGVIPRGATLASFRRWHCCGTTLCSKAFCSVVGIKEGKLCKIKQQILEGHFEPLETGFWVKNEQHVWGESKLLARLLLTPAFHCKGGGTSLFLEAVLHIKPLLTSTAPVLIVLCLRLDKMPY
jgi:hypothetical protein